MSTVTDFLKLVCPLRLIIEYLLLYLITKYVDPIGPNHVT